MGYASVVHVRDVEWKMSLTLLLDSDSFVIGVLQENLEIEIIQINENN
jgi:hypothetical protein